MMLARAWHRAGVGCKHMGKTPPHTDHDDRVEIPAGAVFGPVRTMGVFTTPQCRYVSVVVPMGPRNGLRWVNIWLDDRNQPLNGVRMAIPLKANIPDLLLQSLNEYYVSGLRAPVMISDESRELMDTSLLDLLGEPSERPASAPPASVPPPVPGSSLD